MDDFLVSYCKFSRVSGCVMICSNIDNGFSKRSYLRIEKAQSSKHCTEMEIVIIIGMKSICLVVYVNYYISCLCVINATV